LYPLRRPATMSSSSSFSSNPSPAIGSPLISPVATTTLPTTPGTFSKVGLHSVPPPRRHRSWGNFRNCHKKEPNYAYNNNGYSMQGFGSSSPTSSSSSRWSWLYSPIILVTLVLLSGCFLGAYCLVLRIDNTLQQQEQTSASTTTSSGSNTGLKMLATTHITTTITDSTTVHPELQQLQLQEEQQQQPQTTKVAFYLNVTIFEIPCDDLTVQVGDPSNTQTTTTDRLLFKDIVMPSSSSTESNSHLDNNSNHNPQNDYMRRVGKFQQEKMQQQAQYQGDAALPVSNKEFNNNNNNIRGLRDSRETENKVGSKTDDRQEQLDKDVAETTKTKGFLGSGFGGLFSKQELQPQSSHEAEQQRVRHRRLEEEEEQGDDQPAQEEQDTSNHQQNPYESLQAQQQQNDSEDEESENHDNLDGGDHASNENASVEGLDNSNNNEDGEQNQEGHDNNPNEENNDDQAEEGGKDNSNMRMVNQEGDAAFHRQENDDENEGGEQGKEEEGHSFSSAGLQQHETTEGGDNYAVGGSSSSSSQQSDLFTATKPTNGCRVTGNLQLPLGNQPSIVSIKATTTTAGSSTVKLSHRVDKLKLGVPASFPKEEMLIINKFVPQTYTAKSSQEALVRHKYHINDSYHLVMAESPVGSSVMNGEGREIQFVLTPPSALMVR